MKMIPSTFTQLGRPGGDPRLGLKLVSLPVSPLELEGRLVRCVPFVYRNNNFLDLKVFLLSRHPVALAALREYLRRQSWASIVSPTVD